MANANGPFGPFSNQAADKVETSRNRIIFRIEKKALFARIGFTGSTTCSGGCVCTYQSAWFVCHLETQDFPAKVADNSLPESAGILSAFPLALLLARRQLPPARQQLPPPLASQLPPPPRHQRPRPRLPRLRPARPAIGLLLVTRILQRYALVPSCPSMSLMSPSLSRALTSPVQSQARPTCLVTPPTRAYGPYAYVPYIYLSLTLLIQRQYSMRVNRHQLD